MRAKLAFLAILLAILTVPASSAALPAFSGYAHVTLHGDSYDCIYARAWFEETVSQDAYGYDVSRYTIHGVYEGVGGLSCPQAVLLQVEVTWMYGSSGPVTDPDWGDDCDIHGDFERIVHPDGYDVRGVWSQCGDLVEVLLKRGFP